LRITVAGGNFRGVEHPEKSEGMNALVKKEIRLLLPSFLISLLLALSIWLLPEHLGSKPGITNNFLMFSFLFCPVMLVMMILGSFGSEFSSGTFSMLLSQPVSRARIWWTKTLLLAFAVLLVWFAWCYSSILSNQVNANLRDMEIFTALFALAMYSGGLWAVLLLRQVAAAFWFAVLTPAALLMTVTNLLENYPDKVVTKVLIVVFVVYGIAGFLFARWLFMRAQDVAWTGGIIALPEIRGLKWWGERPREPQAAFDIGSSVASPHRTWRPRAALFWKELQLHQSQFVLAGALALLHLGVIATRKYGNLESHPDLRFVLKQFWLLWLVMPMLVGSAAVAEERKLGTLAGQLCLPVKRRIQFTMKLRVVLLLSLLLGVVMPLLLEGTRILPGVHVLPSGFHFDYEGNYLLMPMNTWLSFFWYCLMVINSLTPLLMLLGMATAIGAISFYASTLARNTLQALAPAVLEIIVFAFLFFGASRPELLFNYPLWHGPLIYFIGVPAFVIVLVALSFWNCQRTDPGWNVWRRNAFVFVAALAFVMAATTAIYHRAWEKLTPFEPAHGTARFLPSNPPTLREQWNTFSVRLPDGRIWTDDYTLNPGTPIPLALFLGDIRLTSLGGGHFYDGSNWVSVILGAWSQRAGIKADGTLWVSEILKPTMRFRNGPWQTKMAAGLTQFGSETNWNSVVPIGGLEMLLVKNDGTLWRWGTTNWNYKKYNEWPGFQAFTPQRLGTESNWAKVFLADNQLCLRKTDGSLWMQWNGGQEQQIKLGTRFSVGRASLPQPGQWRDTTTIKSGLNYHLGVRDDGTFRIWADQKLIKTKHQNNYELRLTPVDLQFGKDTNWLGVAGRGQKIVTLKDDGSLWLWNFYHDDRRGWDTARDEHEMMAVKPVRLGTHTDWIAVANADGGIISLAADGGVWYWPLESAGRFAGLFSLQFWDNNSNTYSEPLLDISRKPQLLGNVFGKAD
jgi:hypothetical protein